MGSGAATPPSPTAGKGHTVEECAANAGLPDHDGDGLSDLCEAALARSFAPELLADPEDCALPRDGTRPLAGGYFYAVSPLGRSGEVVRIAFMPAYYRDCGWRGMQRLLRVGRGNAHAGDSELIVLEVRRDDAAQWRTVAVFLSAHCFGRSDGRCRWFRGRDLDDEFTWVAGRGGAPQVWVARDKHANYPSRCESGHWHQERCARSPARYRFPIERPEQNIGSRALPQFGREACVRAEQLPLRLPGSVAGTTECLWSREGPFRGWQHGPGAATPYGLVLQRLAGL